MKKNETADRLLNSLEGKSREEVREVLVPLCENSDFFNIIAMTFLQRMCE